MAQLQGQVVSVPRSRIYVCYQCNRSSQTIQEVQCCPRCGSEFVAEREIDPLGAIFEAMNQVVGFYTFGFNIIREPAPAAAGLSKAEIRNIPLVQLTTEQINNKVNCIICFEDFKLKENVNRLNCNHMFHLKCLAPWLRLNKTCPTCRASVIVPKVEPEEVPSASQQSGRIGLRRQATQRATAHTPPAETISSAHQEVPSAPQQRRHVGRPRQATQRATPYSRPAETNSSEHQEVPSAPQQRRHVCRPRQAPQRATPYSRPAETDSSEHQEVLSGRILRSHSTASTTNERQGPVTRSMTSRIH